MDLLILMRPVSSRAPIFTSTHLSHLRYLLANFNHSFSSSLTLVTHSTPPPSTIVSPPLPTIITRSPSCSFSHLTHPGHSFSPFTTS